MAKTAQGADLQALVLSDTKSDGNSGATVTYSATTVTDTAKTWVATTGQAITGVAGQWAGKVVVSGNVWGTVLSNTATVLTIDTWKSVSATGAITTGATTPSANAAYTILPGASPSFYMAISTDTAAVTGTETALTSELTASGLGRALASYAHTSNTTTYTLQKIFTYTGSTATTVAKVGIFNAYTTTPPAGVLMFVTLLPATATVTANGDTLTVTETVTLS